MSVSADPSRPTAAPRSCGGCTACCKTHQIAELGKPAGQWCGHCLPGKGCAIYAERPSECDRFNCLWRLGFGPDRIRPDKVRIVLDTPRLLVRGREIELVSMHELSPGSIATAAGREIERNLLANQAIVMQVFLQFSPPRLKFIIPPGRRADATMDELVAAVSPDAALKGAAIESD